MKIVEVPQLQSISKPSSPPMLKHALHFCVETTWPAVLCAVHRPRLASALRSSVLGKPWMPWSMLSEHTCFFFAGNYAINIHQRPSKSIRWFGCCSFHRRNADGLPLGGTKGALLSHLLATKASLSCEWNGRFLDPQNCPPDWRAKMMTPRVLLYNINIHKETVLKMDPPFNLLYLKHFKSKKSIVMDCESFNATFITFMQATSQPLWAPMAAAIARRMAMLELELAMAQFPSWLQDLRNCTNRMLKQWTACHQRRCITRLGHFLECHCCCARVAVAASLRILLNILLSMFLWGALNSYGDKGCFRMHRAPAARRFIIPIEVSLPAPCFSTCPSDPSKFGHVAGHHLPWPWLQNLRETRASSECFRNTFTRLSPESLGYRTAAAALASAVSRAKPASPL